MNTTYGKLALLALAIALAALLFLPVEVGEEDSLLVSPEGLKMSVGDSYTLSCALRSEDMNQTLRFESSDERVASVDAGGTVRALSSGEAVILARASGGASAEAQVTVEGVPLRGLSLNVSELHLEKGQLSGLKVSYNEDATDANIRWVSSDERVVRVDETGRVEGVGGGEAYVSAVSSGGLSATAKVYVEVAGMAAHITPNALTLGVGARVPLRVSFLPLDCTDRVLRWASSDPSVLAVDASGAISAVGEGSAYLSAITEGGLSCGMVVQVERAPSDIQLEPARAHLERGETLDMQLMLLDEAGNAQPNSGHLTAWSSSDERVAQVDAQGRVTALASGSCVIRAEADGLSASCELSVSVAVQEVSLNLSEAYLYPSQAASTLIQLEWSLTPADADDQSLIFASDNELVAQVSEQGLVTMTGQVGVATITASSASGARESFVVNVVEQPAPEPTATATAAPTATATAEAATAVTATPQAAQAASATPLPTESAAPAQPSATPLPSAVG